MVEVGNAKEIVESLRLESQNYFRQWVVWLGVGSAGGAAALVVATSLPDSNYAFRIFLPSLWLVVIGAAAAGLSVLFASLSTQNAAEHFAESHNRESFTDATKKMPYFFSAPKRLADESNRHQNDLIKKSNDAHGRSELSRKRHRIWRRLRTIAVTLSAIGFIIGFAWPLTFVTFGGKLAP